MMCVSLHTTVFSVAHSFLQFNNADNAADNSLDLLIRCQATVAAVCRSCDLRQINPSPNCHQKTKCLQHAFTSLHLFA
jgi:hypothetical protein